MATITLVRPSDGQTITVDKTSVLYNHYLGQGWIEQTTQQPKPSPTPTPTPPSQPSTLQWYLSSWTGSGGTWQQQPVLTINGQQFRFNTPQEYIDKMNQAGINDGQANTFKQQFQNIASGWNSGSNQNTQQLEESINGLYNKYFGRGANLQELNFWKTQPINALETQLKQDYKVASGIDYDGSPIRQGNQKTDNQLKAPTQSTPQPTTPSGLTLQTLLNDPRVKQDQGHNNVTMAQWLQGNSSLIPQLAQLGYKVDDLINEAYSQTRTNKSAFSGDMTVVPRSQNNPTGTTPEVTPPTGESDKKIYKRGSDLYIKTGDKFYKIPDPATLYDLVTNKGYQDVRENLPVDAPIGDFGEQTDEILEETPDLTDLFSSTIDLDPFLQEQFQDENTRQNFDKMSPELQMAYLQMMQSLGRQIEAGKVLNPNIEITPEKVQEFTNQATSELDPYYQEVINNYKDDLNTSILRLKTDFETGVRNAEDPFKRNLAAVAESEAQAGLTYGSERAKREQTNVLGQQQLIDENALKVQRSAEDAYKQAERTIGSDALSGVSIPNIKDYNVNKLGFAESGLRNLYATKGNLVGTFQKEKTTNIRTRASELEDAYRQNRILNTSQLTPNVSTSVSTSNPTAPNPSAPTSYVSNYVTLPGGQKISKSDPNIEDYKRYYPTLF